MSPFKFNYKYDEELKQLDLNFTTQKELDETLALFIGFDIETVFLHGDFADHFQVPEGVVYVGCSFMGLKSIYLPDSVEFLYADRNHFRSIELPAGLVKASLRDNILSEIKFREPPTQLIELDLFGNRLLALDFPVPESFTEINVDKNFYLKHISDDIQRVINECDNPFDPPR